jgi:hypothetical protein
MPGSRLASRSGVRTRRGQYTIAPLPPHCGVAHKELDDEWEVERRYFSQESMHKLFIPETLLEPAAIAPRLAPVR